MTNGEIYEEGEHTDTIGLADFDTTDYQTLNSIGMGLFAKPAAVNEVQANPETKMLQGFLEDSNVDPILAMVDMIELFRSFELGQKSIQIQDMTLQRVITEVGIVR